MASITCRPFAYNPTGDPVSGATTLGFLAIGYADQDYSGSPGLSGLTWWMGPDEELGYVIARAVIKEDHPTQFGKIGGVQFWRSTVLSEQSFIDLASYIAQQNFRDTTEAGTWLSSNGYWSLF